MKNINGCFSLKDLKFPISVRHYGHEARTEMHSHDFVELAFVDRGFTMHWVEGNTSLLLPGDIFFILPGIRHEYWRSVNNSVYNCLFYPEVLGQDLDVISRLPLLDMVLKAGTSFTWNKMHLGPDARHEILSLLKKLTSETGDMPAGWEIRSKALLMDLLVSISRVWSSVGSSPDFGNAPVAATASGFMHIMEQSARSRMSIEKMARAAGYSPEYFSRVFKKITGLSPSAYLTSARIAAAAEKLLAQDASIADIAGMIGFDDVNYFSRLFKKETGSTPTEFRNMVKTGWGGSGQ